MSAGCELTLCRQNDQECKCYIDQSRFQEGDSVNDVQICAYESDEGYLFPCDAGCCPGGCPGQCPGVSPRPPQEGYTPKLKPKSPKYRNLFIYWNIIVLLLFIITVL